MTSSRMAIKVDLQNDDAFESIPRKDDFRVWVESALQQKYSELEQTIRIVGLEEGRNLNSRYRGLDRATNVLAFREQSDLLDYDCLGDLVICAPVVVAEASAQARTERAHWAHLVIHGMLHLQGYDHQDSADTAEMEQLEIQILDGLGYANPYND